MKKRIYLLLVLIGVIILSSMAFRAVTQKKDPLVRAPELKSILSDVWKVDDQPSFDAETTGHGSIRTNMPLKVGSKVDFGVSPPQTVTSVQWLPGTMYHLNRTPQDVAREVKKSLTIQKGWGISFPAAGSYELSGDKKDEKGNYVLQIHTVAEKGGRGTGLKVVYVGAPYPQWRQWIRVHTGY